MKAPRVGLRLQDLPGLTDLPRRASLVAVLSPGCGGCLRSSGPLVQAARALGATPLALIDRFAADAAEADEMLVAVQGAGINIGSDELCQQVKDLAEITGYPSFLLVDTTGTVTHSALGLDQLDEMTTEAAARAIAP